jgi:site-specific DNA-cytosine methylase
MHAWATVPALSQPSFCRLADGLPDDLVRGRRGALKAYGNAVVPAVAEVIGRRLMEIANG